MNIFKGSSPYMQSDESTPTDPKSFVNLFVGLLRCENDDSGMRVWTVVRNGRSIRRLKSVAAFEKREGACRLTVDYFAVERAFLDSFPRRKPLKGIAGHRAAQEAAGTQLQAYEVARRWIGQEGKEERLRVRDALREFVERVDVRLSKEGSERSAPIGVRLSIVLHPSVRDYLDA